MSKSNHTASICFKIAIVLALSFSFLSGAVFAKQAQIKRIKVSQNPLSIKIYMSKKVPTKVIQVEQKQLLVALKNANIQKKLKIEGKESTTIKNIGVEKLQGDVVAVVVTSTKPYGFIKSSYNASDSSFIVNLEKKTVKKTPPLPAAETPKPKPAPSVPEPEGVEPELIKTEIETKDEQAPDPVKREDVLKKAKEPARETKTEVKAEKPVDERLRKKLPPVFSVYVPPAREKSPYKGDISDLIGDIQQSDCNSKQLDNAILLLNKKLYEKAFKVLDQYILQENFSCLEQAYFLRAYAFYRTVEKEDFANLIKAEQLFQDALIAYPKSGLVPYGYTAIGLIQKRLNNVSAAEGYFNIVKQGYLEYPGLTEVMFHLAEIYDVKGYEDKATRYYKQVFEDTVENSYIVEAGVGYGKALFKKRQYYDTLSVLNYVVKTSPKRVYKSSELLLFMGNANFEVGQSREARKHLNRVLNLFPEIKGKDVILSKIGDTYGMENNEEKAIKVYELVREKYPDTEGYIASSIGIARYMKKDEDKMEIYTMIKTKFPENKYARIAMMRLAEIYQANKEYNKCIKEIEDLLSTHPRGLRYEAVKLMQRAYEKLFQRQNKANEYTKVLNRYELEHTRIDRMGSRLIELNVGLAYLEAKLYEQAFNHLIIAYKQYKRSARTSELLYGLGMAMEESGRKDDALKLYEGFAKRFSRNKYRGDALTKAGNIYLEKKQYKSSSKKYKQAYAATKDHLKKGDILMQHAIVYENKSDLKTAAKYREKAAKEIALASGENYEKLTRAYKELGRTFFELKKYVKSADAYHKALNFSKDEREKANLGFLLGDAYQKGNILSKAKEAYEQVVTSNDSIWARLAQQRLNMLALAQTVQST